MTEEDYFKLKEGDRIVANYSFEDANFIRGYCYEITDIDPERSDPKFGCVFVDTAREDTWRHFRVCSLYLEHYDLDHSCKNCQTVKNSEILKEWFSEV